MSKKILTFALILLISPIMLLSACENYSFSPASHSPDETSFTINVISSDSNIHGVVTAQYTYYPGSTINFPESMRIGTERYRYVQQPNGSTRQYENTAFSFRFKMYVEFPDASEESARAPRTDIIQHVIEPEDIDAKILLNPDDAGVEADNIFSYDGEWFYYYGVVIPGEKYIPFIDGFSIYDHINSEYQGKRFIVTLKYDTIIPNNDITGVLEDVPDAPTSWAAYIVSEYQAYYAW